MRQRGRHRGVDPMKALHRYTLLLLLPGVLAFAAWASAAQAQAEHAEPPVIAAALEATVTLTPTADTYVQSNAPGTSFATLPEFQVLVDRTVAVIDANALLQFDLSVLPTGAIINRAELRLYQTAASGANWSLNM